MPRNRLAPLLFAALCLLALPAVAGTSEIALIELAANLYASLDGYTSEATAEAWERFGNLSQGDLEKLLPILEAEQNRYNDWYYDFLLGGAPDWDGQIMYETGAMGPRYMGRLINETKDRLGILPFDLVVDGRIGAVAGGIMATVEYEILTDDGRILPSVEGYSALSEVNWEKPDARYRCWLIERRSSDNNVFYNTIKAQVIDPDYYVGQEIPEAWTYEREH